MVSKLLFVLVALSAVCGPVTIAIQLFMERKMSLLQDELDRLRIVTQAETDAVASMHKILDGMFEMIRSEMSRASSDADAVARVRTVIGTLQANTENLVSDVTAGTDLMTPTAPAPAPSMDAPAAPSAPVSVTVAEPTEAGATTISVMPDAAAAVSDAVLAAPSGSSVAISGPGIAEGTTVTSADVMTGTITIDKPTDSDHVGDGTETLSVSAPAP